MKYLHSADTIAAPATAAGKGGIGIIRVSGPNVRTIAFSILGELPKPRYAMRTVFRCPNGSVIDEGIAIYFPAPHSLTGEDVLELQGHGGPFVLDQLLHGVLHLGARLANPGEFSQRAFLNGKMDLTQAEAIADLINASSEQAAHSAVRSLQGEFSKYIHEFLNEIIQLRMLVEAAIDFSEEEIDFLSDNHVKQGLESLIQRLESVEQSATQGVLLQEGLTVVIAGEPNAGKSSLLNQLSGKDSAIVTDIAGTTRDLLKEHINIQGIPIHIIDTAGLRDTNDPVEQEGVRRAKQAMQHANLILVVIDATTINRDIMNHIPQDITNLPHSIPLVIVNNKIDLTNEPIRKLTAPQGTIISLSAKTGAGISLLKEHVALQCGLNQTQEGTFIARRRHLVSLAQAKASLIHGLNQLNHHQACELLAEDLRCTQMALNEITGEFTSDDLLGKIFGSFCIGK